MLIGRDPELARIEQLLAAARLGTSETLVLAGGPGMGKTALLEHAVERAQGMLVLRARGVESEAEIPFAGLHALLRPAFDRLDALPQPQAAALRAALGLAPGVGGERFLIGAATLSPARRARRGAPGAGRRRRRALAGRVLVGRDPVRRAPPVRRHGRVRD